MINSSSNPYDVIIIGGGASGLMCASYLHYLKPSALILILERNQKIGNKIYITGNGRCNLTNTSITYVDYSTDNYEYLKTIFDEYSVDRTIEFFTNNLGLHLAYKEDLVYPNSFKSSSVVDSFKFALKDVDIKYNEFVKSTSKQGEVFEVNTSENSYYARNIVFAGGGSAAPKTGSDGNIYKLILNYANKNDFTQVVPSLVQLKTLESDTHKLAGTRVQSEVSIFSNDESIASFDGEMMFTDYGVSGICVFCLSGYYSNAVLEGKKNLVLRVNLLPGNSEEDILNILKKKVSLFPDRSMVEILMGFYTRELSEVIASRGENNIEKIAKVIKNFSFTITGTMGFDNAQVTSGGVNLGSLSTECKLTEGVYVIGEAVNVDGPCGGYNLQWAWSSAMASANSISKEAY